MQTQLDTFNKLEQLSNTLFCGFNQIGGRDNTQFNSNVTSADSPGGELLDSANTILKGSVKALDSYIPHSIIDDYLGPDVGKEPWDDIAPNLINNIEESGRIVSEAVKNPEVRKALKKAIVVYGKALNEVYDIAEPQIDELVTKFWITIDKMGEKSARGATNAMIDTVSAAVAEIPVVGGVVDLLIASGKWFNAVASGIVAPTIIAHGEVTGKAIYTGREGLAIKKKYGEELSSATSELVSALSQSVPSAEERSLRPPGSPPRESVHMPPVGERTPKSLDTPLKKPVPMTIPYNPNNPNNSTIRRDPDRGGSNRVVRRESTQNRKTGTKGTNSGKLGYKKAKTARTVKKTKSQYRSHLGGHHPFMFGGSKKSSNRARKTAKRLLKSIKRFTKKSRK